MVSFEVPPGGGAYEVLAHHGDALALHFSEPVQLAYSLHRASGITVQRHAQDVTVSLSRTTRHGSVVVYTKSAHVVVGIKASSPDQNAYLAEFKILTPAEQRLKVRDELRRFKREMDAQIEQKKALLARHGEQLAREEIERRNARAMANSHCDIAINALARSKSLIFRVHNIECLGDVAYIRFTVQNTRNTILPIQAVRLSVNGVDKTRQVAFQQRSTRSAQDSPPEVPPGSQLHGVATLADFSSWKSSKITLTIIEATSGNQAAEAASIAWSL